MDEKELRDELEHLGTRLATSQQMVERLTRERDNFAANVDVSADIILRYRAALERIAAVRYGLELRDTDEEAARYWANLCQEYRRIACEALKGEK
jgi:predicted RNase H-like nuclease (RuvC/YqgF family)